MSVKIITKATQAAEAVKKSEAQLLDMAICEAVDAVAATEAAYKASKKVTEKLEKEYKNAKEHLETLAEQAMEPGDSKHYTGEKSTVDIGPRAWKITAINTDVAFQLLNKVKKGLAFELMKFNAGDLEKYLTPEQVDQVIVRERAGSRSFKFDEV